MEELQCKTVFTIPVFGGIPVAESVAVTWVIMAVLLILSLVLVRNLSVENPGKKQILLETGVSFLHDFFKDILGEEGKMYIPYLMTVVIYIGIANIFGVFGFVPPTKDLNCTIGLPLTSIFLIEYAGFHKKGLKGFLKSGISRGKVEASVSIYNQEGTDAEIELNKAVAKGYLDALRGAADELDLDDDITLSHIMKLPDVFTVVKKTDDEEVIWNEVKDVAQVALDRFVQMRETEGVKMYDDISGRLDYIEETVGKIEDQSPSVTESYRERLYAKIKETLGDKDIDEQRILTEVAIFADKVAIDEETVRLRSHISQFRGLIKSDEPVGRKLDFLVQELNREVNTIGSKANDLTITKMVVDLKAEIEKIREQIQNIE